MDSISGTFGQFYVPTLKSSTNDETKLLFLQRTEIGSFLHAVGTDGRDLGLMIGGNFEMLNWGIAIQNGGDGTQDEHRITLNVSADVMGKGAGAVEGAYGAAEGNNLMVGGFYHSEDDAADLAVGDAFGVEAYFTMGAFAVAAEYADFDSFDRSPYDITGSFLFTEMYEAAVRYEDRDDVDSTTAISVGVNRYSAGHNLKWTAQYRTVDSDDAGEELDEISIGATLAF